ncbi:unnamed protein product [Rotaria magnacalcarata]
MSPPKEMAMENMIKYCETNAGVNFDKRVDEFRSQYPGHNAIVWYSRDGFFKKIFDRDLRSTDMSLILYFGFYLNDLYNALRRKFSHSPFSDSAFIVYRGQTLPRRDLEELKEKIGCLIANNSFLSTTCDRNIAFKYAIDQKYTLPNEPVLFEIHISEKSSHRPFADISDISHVKGEILLSVNTIFRIDSVREPSSDKHFTSRNLWEISLTMCESKLTGLNDYFDVIILRLAEILRRISPDNDRTNKKMLDRCRLYYAHDPIELEKIADFERNYEADQAIRWYAKDSFLYRILNAALRQNDMKTIIDLGFFVVDLHDQLAKTQMEYLRTLPVKDARKFVLYRGQLMSRMELGKLKDYIGHYITVSSFFSTTSREDIALIYSGYDLCHSSSSYESVVFVITINLHKMSCTTENMRQPIFAKVNHHSVMLDEEEVLLAPQNIFRLKSIEKRSHYPVSSIFMTLCTGDEYVENVQDHLNVILSPNIYLETKKLTSVYSLEDLIRSKN